VTVNSPPQSGQLVGRERIKVPFLNGKRSTFLVA
jgi:hypothetical protein